MGTFFSCRHFIASVKSILDFERVLNGNAGDDYISGGIGNDTLSGAEGDDSLNGGDGNDSLNGGAGDDTYYVDNASDSIIETVGTGQDKVYASVSYALSDNVEDLYLYSETAVVGIGNASDNLIRGNGSDNRLEGKAGNDYLIGNGGNDTLDGGEGNNKIEASYGNDSISTGAGNDVIDAGSGDNTINAGDGGNTIVSGGGIDKITTGAGRDTISAGDGDNVINAGEGNNTIVTGSGADRIDTGADSDSIKAGDGNNVIHSGAGSDSITAGAGDDVIDAGSGNNTVNAGNGKNTITVGAGDDNISTGVDADVINAGDGNNTIYSGNGNDQINTGKGNDTIRTGSGNNIIRSTGGNDVIDTGSGSDDIQTGAGDDQIKAGDGNNSVNAGDGNNSVYVWDGSSHVVTGSGRDTINRYGSGSSTITSGAGDDSLNIKGGNDVISTGDGNDSLYSDANDQVDLGAGNDSAFITGGSNTINAGAGDDLVRVMNVSNVAGLTTIDGGDGNDTLSYSYGPGAVVMYGGNGNDVLSGGGEQDTLNGGEGNDEIYGVDGDDLIDAGAGNDRISAGDGNDSVIAGAGDDHISGGYGNNTIDAGAGNDEISIAGTDVVRGGTGQDRVYSWYGTNSTYQFAYGDEQDVIDNDPNQGVSTLEFLNGIASNQISVMANGNDLVFSIIGTSDTVTIKDAIIEEDSGRVGLGERSISNVIFGNESWGKEQILLALLKNDHSIYGTAGDDEVYGDVDANLIRTGTGNDVLNGGLGADTMYGGSGDDIYIVDHAQDMVVERIYSGNDTVKSSISYTLTDNVEQLILTGNANINGTGNELNNLIEGNSGVNVLSGGAGDDIYVVDASDLVIESVDGGEDTVRSAVSVTLNANVEKLRLLGTLSANGTGNELDNSLYGNEADNILNGLDGNDFLLAYSGNDILFGGNGDDEIFGQDGNDVLNGGAGSDTLYGGKGNDVFDGGAGEDILLGEYTYDPNLDEYVYDGLGNDSYLFGRGDGVDIIYDPDSTMGNVDQIIFKAGVTTSDVLLSRTDNNLVVSIVGTTDQLTVFAYFDDQQGETATGNGLVEEIRFSDGTVWNAQTIKNILYPSNHVPTVEQMIDNQTATQGQAFSFVIPTTAFKDIDAGDVLSYSVTKADGTALPSWLTFNATTRTLSGTPANGDVGSLSFAVKATDKAGAAATSIFGLTVANVNDAPVVEQAITAQTATQGQAFSFVIPTTAFKDIDAGDVLSYSVTKADGTALPSWLTFNATTRTLSGTPANGDVGSLSFAVKASDKAGAAVTSIFGLTVANVNDAPVVDQAITIQTATQGQAFSFVIPTTAFKDIDVGDVLSYSVTKADGTALPSWLTFNATTRTLSGTPVNGDVGSLSFTVKAMDMAGATATSTFGLAVANLTFMLVNASGVTENSAAGTEVATLAGVAPDVGNTLTYAIAGGVDAGLFEIVGNQLKIKTGAVIDFETNPVINLDLRLTDQGGLSFIKSVQFNVLNVVEATDDDFASTAETIGALSSAMSKTGNIEVANDTDWFKISVVKGVTYVFDLKGSPTGSGTLSDTYIKGIYDSTGALIANTTNNDFGGVLNSQVTFTATSTGSYFISAGAYGSHVGTYTLNMTVCLGSTIIGTALNDSLYGDAGNDIIDGKAGADYMEGGAGDDIYYVDDYDDLIIEQHNSGFDTVYTSESGYYMDWFIEKLIVIDGIDNVYAYGGSTDNIMVGNALCNRLNGGLGNDTLYGNAGDDELEGSVGNDTLNGGDGNDWLDGGWDNDTLIGGSGNDILTGDLGFDCFVFDTALSELNNDVDTILDFDIGQMEQIKLDDAIFESLSSVLNKTIDASMFIIGTSAKDANDYIIYNQINGNIFYDADGSGAGASVLFADVQNGLALTYSNFYVI